MFITFLLWTATISLHAEDKSSWQPIGSMPAFMEKMKSFAASTQSIEADFTQEKYLDVFAEKVESKGKFSFSRPGKIRLEYIEPVAYLMVINDKDLKIVSEGKTNIISLGANQMMGEMKNMLAACMSGDLSDLSAGYTTDYLENADSYLLVIRPKSKSILAYISEMRIELDKKDMAVVTLRLTEPGRNYTEYQFANRKYNITFPDETFAMD